MADVTPKIRKCLEKQLKDNFGTSYTISWENTNTRKKNNGDPISVETAVLDVRFVPSLREPSVRGRNPQIYYRGYLLVEICVQKGKGPAEADRIASELIDHFEVTTDFTFDNVDVHIRYAERDLGVSEDTHYKVPVRVGWQTYA